MIALLALAACSRTEAVEPTVLLEHPWGYQLVADVGQADAVSVYGGCLGNVEACVESGTGDLDFCVRDVPTRLRPKPGQEPACPSACVKEYTRRVDAGEPAAEAFLAVFVDEAATCFPDLPDSP